MAGNMSGKRMITSNPMLFGILISLLIFVVIIVTETWFPWTGEALGRHKRLVQAVYFTGAFFAICVYRFGSWRRRNALAFWASMCFLFVLHVLGVFFYSTHVQPILGWQWVILISLETFVVIFFVDWTTRRFGHFDRHRSPR